MMLMIWERYFLRELLKIFSLFLFTFYGLYVLIDYSNHAKQFQHYHFSVSNVVFYYAYEFITRMDLLVPFAILIAGIKTLCSLNTRNELTALKMSGVPLKRLLLPFILFALFFTSMLYVNTEFFLPNAVKYHKKLDFTRAKEKQKKRNHPFIQQINLEDNSSLIFQAYDSSQDRFFDVFWIRSIDEVYRMRYLFLRPTPLGESVQQLKRDNHGSLTITQSFDQKEFPDMQFNKNALTETISSINSFSLSELTQKIPERTGLISEKEAKLLTTYYHKLALPWLCLLVIIAIAPFCTRFTRTLPTFSIFALGIFGLIATYLIMDAAVILAERQLLSPEIAIGMPIACLFLFFGYRFLAHTK